MARLKGLKGIDKGALIDVHDSLVEEYTKDGAYELLDHPVAEAQEDHGVLQEWGADEDYSVHGVRGRGESRHASKAAPKAPKE